MPNLGNSRIAGMRMMLLLLVGVSAQPMPETMKCSACKEIAASLEFE